MCVLYAICKVNKIDITFRTIINKYQKQPQANSEVKTWKNFDTLLLYFNNVFKIH
jgi:hypothetical protein